VGVRHHHARDVVHVAEDEVRGLAAYAGEGEQFVHGGGDPAAEVVHQLPGAEHDVPGLGVVKSAGVDVLLHVRDLRLRQGPERGIAGIERRGDLVDPLIRTLGGQPGGEQQLVILVVVQRTEIRRGRAPERLDDGNNILFRFIATPLWTMIPQYREKSRRFFLR
jgi:hypothetical protein